MPNTFQTKEQSIKAEKAYDDWLTDKAEMLKLALTPFVKPATDANFLCCDVQTGGMVTNQNKPNQ